MVSPENAIPTVGSGFQGIPVETVEAIPLNTDDVNTRNIKHSLEITETPRGNEVLIKAAKVIEVNSVEAGTIGSIKISIFGYQYAVVIPNGTKILKSSWAGSKLTEFSVGDIVNVWGFLDSNDNYRINAKTVRNISIQKRHKVFKGTITSLLFVAADETQYQYRGFALKTKNYGIQTVIVDSDAKIFKRHHPAKFSDLKAGMNVVVRGVWIPEKHRIRALVIQIIGEIPPPIVVCPVKYDRKPTLIETERWMRLI
jgi:hypothetical protein